MQISVSIIDEKSFSLELRFHFYYVVNNIIGNSGALHISKIANKLEKLSLSIIFIRLDHNNIRPEGLDHIIRTDLIQSTYFNIGK